MSFSGGVYTLPGPALVTGEIVSATENNQFRNDVAGAFNVTMLRNGTSTATANLPMGGYKLTGLGAATTNGDALSYGAAAVVTTLTSTSLTATRVPYAGTGGLLQDASTFTFDGTTLTAGGFTTSGAISAGTITASGAITVSGGTANGVAYLNGSKVLTTGSALTFDGTTLTGTQSTASQISLNNVSGNYLFFTAAGGAAYIDNRIPSDLNFRGGGNFVWSVYGGSEQMRLTSTGLGIGTSSPGAKLQINGTGIGLAKIVETGTTGYGGINFANTGTQNYTIGMGGVSETAFGVANKWFLYDSLAGAMRLVVDTSGNLGLGVTPSAWGTPLKTLQITAGAGYSATSAFASGFDATYILNNAFYDTQFKYVGSTYATQYQQYQGTHRWYTAPSGTAGNAITFTQAMTLDALGMLGVGTSAPSDTAGYSRALDLNGPSGAAFYARTNGSTTNLTIFANYGADGYIDNRAAGNLLFRNNGSERMRIDSSGNVLIGATTTPSSASMKLAIYAASNGGFQLVAGDNSGGMSQTALGGGGQAFYTYTGGIGSETYTERMRIDSSGNLLVGTTSNPGTARISALQATGISDVYIAKLGSGGSAFTVIGTASTMTVGYFVTSAGGTAGSITCNNNSTTYATSSDYRLKENIQPMQNALDVVAQLNPVTYTWKADGSDGQGFIAHELQAVVPDCVTGEKDAVDEEGNPVYQGIDTSFLTATLSKAIQELHEIVKSQAAEIAELKAKIA